MLAKFKQNFESFLQLISYLFETILFAFTGIICLGIFDNLRKFCYDMVQNNNHDKEAELLSKEKNQRASSQ